MSEDLVPPSMPGQVQLSKKQSFFKKLFSKKDQPEGNLEKTVSMQDHVDLMSSNMGLDTPAKSKPAVSASFAMNTEELDLDKLREHLGLSSDSTKATTSSSFNSSSSFDSIQSMQSPTIPETPKQSKSKNDFFVKKDDEEVKIDYTPIKTSVAPKQKYEEFNNNKFGLDEPKQIKNKNSFVPDTTYFVTSKNYESKENNMAKKAGMLDFTNTNAENSHEVEAQEQEMNKNNWQTFDWAKEGAPVNSEITKVSDVSREDFKSDLKTNPRFAKSKPENQITKKDAEKIEKEFKSTKFDIPMPAPISSKKDMPIKSMASTSKETDFTSMEPETMPTKKEFSFASTDPQSEPVKKSFTGMSSENIFSKKSDLSDMEPAPMSKQGSSSFTSFNDEIKTPVVESMPKSDVVVSMSKEEMMSSDDDENDDIISKQNDFTKEDNDQKEEMIPKLVKKEAPKNLFELSTGETRLVKADLKKEVELFRKQKQNFEQQKIMLAGNAQKLDFKMKQYEKEKASLEKQQEEFDNRVQHFEMKKRDSEELLQNYTAMKKDFSQTKQEHEELKKTIRKNQEKVMALESEIKRLENLKAEKEAGLYEKERMIDQKIALNKSLEENLAKREQTLEHAQSSLNTMENGIRQSGFTNYLDDELSKKTTIVPKTEGMKEFKKEPHDEAFILVNQCRALINQGKIDEAKQAYIKAWQSYHDMLQKGKENEQLYNLVRELYDDLTTSDML